MTLERPQDRAATATVHARCGPWTAIWPAAAPGASPTGSSSSSAAGRPPSSSICGGPGSSTDAGRRRARRAAATRYPGFRVDRPPRDLERPSPRCAAPCSAWTRCPTLKPRWQPPRRVPAPARPSNAATRAFPLQLPVELFFARGTRASASLRDVSRGGVRLSLVPEGCLAALRRGRRSFGLLGLDADPLGREIAAAGAGAVLAVSFAPARRSLAARFLEQPPPV